MPVYNVKHDLDRNPIVFGNFNPAVIDFGKADIETLENKDSFFIKAPLSGRNTSFMKLNPLAKKITITVPQNSEEGKRLRKSIDDYIKKARERTYSENLQVTVMIPSFNTKLTCQDAGWGRPSFEADFRDPDAEMSFELYLPNVKEEAIE